MKNSIMEKMKGGQKKMKIASLAMVAFMFATLFATGFVLAQESDAQGRVVTPTTVHAYAVASEAASSSEITSDEFDSEQVESLIDQLNDLMGERRRVGFHKATVSNGYVESGSFGVPINVLWIEASSVLDESDQIENFFRGVLRVGGIGSYQLSLVDGNEEDMQFEVLDQGTQIGTMDLKLTKDLDPLTENFGNVRVWNGDITLEDEELSGEVTLISRTGSVNPALPSANVGTNMPYAEGVRSDNSGNTQGVATPPTQGGGSNGIWGFFRNVFGRRT